MVLSLPTGKLVACSIANVLEIGKKMETQCYTNDLHDALLQKNSKLFWQSWHSKFGHKSSCSQVDGCVDADLVACKFRDHFVKAYSCNNADRAEQLKHEYQSLRNEYGGMPISDVHIFDTDLVSYVIADLKRGNSQSPSSSRLFWVANLLASRIALSRRVVIVLSCSLAVSLCFDVLARWTLENDTRTNLFDTLYLLI